MEQQPSCIIQSSFLNQEASSDNIPLKLHYTKVIQSDIKNPIASIIIIHGLGQYSELYYDLAEYFSSYKYVCHLIDLRGFGYSGGVKGLSNFEDMIKDIELLLQQVRKDIPLFVCGHSLGASLLLSIGVRNPNLNISGFIALAPLVDPDRHGYERKNGIISKFTQYGVRILGEFLGDILQSNWAIQQNLKKGKNLMVQNIGLQMVKSLLKGIRQLNDQACSFKYPIFILQGSQDCVCNLKKTENFFDMIDSSDKAMQVIPSISHEIIQDDCSGRVKLEVLAWMQLRLQNARPFSETQIQIKTYKQASPKWRLLKMLLGMLFAKTISNISLFYNKGILFQKVYKMYMIIRSFLIF
ncbi:hypothetical protein ABPG74_006008 [Tetrahymena malaccensis]